MCAASNTSERVYYQPASDKSLASCPRCGPLVGESFGLYTVIGIGAAGALLLLAAVQRKLPDSILTRAALIRDAAKPETKLKILSARSVRRSRGGRGGCVAAAVAMAGLSPWRRLRRWRRLGFGCGGGGTCGG